MLLPPFFAGRDPNHRRAVVLYNGSMPVPLLATKLYIPSLRPGSVRRPRLINRLNDGLTRKLALVSASAGFGKTTLLSEWVAGYGQAVGWLSLDESDRDPVRFLTYFIAALRTIAPNLGEEPLAALHSPQPPSVEPLLTSLLNEISTLPGKLILVLDDYHLLDCPAVDHSLAFLVAHQPPQLHLVIASREDPPLPLARLRARGQLLELRTADLRFTSGEAADFLNQTMELSLSAEDVAALEARTEGWIAGLQLAALSMQGKSDTTPFIQSFTGSHRFVLDYLLEEVLQRQPEALQDFLLCTSILERLCAPLCESVFPDVPGQATLEALEHANLFIVPLDNERRWYRYHHLFGDLLRQRLQQGRGEGVAVFHLRASQWHEANGGLMEAYSHALAAKDFERAARLAEAAWPGMDSSFQPAAWLMQVKKLPEAVICSRPVLCVQLGRAFSDVGDPLTSESHLQNAERALARSAGQEDGESLPGTIALARSYNAQVQGDLDNTVKYAELAARLIPEEDTYRRAQATIMLQFTHWASGNLDASLRALYDWMDTMHKMGNQVFVVASAFAVADLLVALGRLGEAEKALRDALQLAARQGGEAEPITAHHHLGLAMLAHERGDEPAAAQYLQTAATRGQQTTLVDWPYRWQVAQARLKESAGEFAAALERLDEARRLYTKTPVPDLRPVEAFKARLYLRQGRLDKAQAWARQRGLSPADEVNYLGEYEHLVLARLCVAERSFSGVNELLDRLRQAAEGQDRRGDALEILVVQVLTFQAQGHLSQALATLDGALTLAETEGYLRTFVDEGEPMQRLLANLRATIEKQSHPGRHPSLGYLDRILAAFPPAAPAPKPVASQVFSRILEPLTERELEVLRLIAQGFSNTEIGQRLYLALSTVKGHNLRIFAKLHVQNRTEAVVRARELGLL